LRLGGDIYSEDGKTRANVGAIVPMFRYLVTQKFELGVAYDYSFTQLGANQIGTFEFMLGYNLCGNGKTVRFVNPRYVNYF
jgi:hypothetical protein